MSRLYTKCQTHCRNLFIRTDINQTSHSVSPKNLSQKSEFYSQCALTVPTENRSYEIHLSTQQPRITQLTAASVLNVATADVTVKVKRVGKFTNDVICLRLVSDDSWSCHISKITSWWQCMLVWTCYKLIEIL